MASYRPRRAQRPTRVVRVARITVPALVVGTLAAGVAVAAWPQQPSLSAVPVAAGTPTVAAVPKERAVPERVTRGQVRSELSSAEQAAQTAAQRADAAQQAAAAKKSAAAQKSPAQQAEAALDLTVVGARYLTEDLNLRTEPKKKAKVLKVLDTRSKVSITDTVEHGFRLIVVKDKGRWVTDEYLAKKKPPKEPEISDAPCDKNPGVEDGLVPNGDKVYRALCARFPNITAFGGRRAANGGFHPTGQAVDAMISNGGWEVARWVRANASRLGVSEVIHAQHIWTVQRSSEGWRSMPDRGNATANHYDHVHVSVY